MLREAETGTLDSNLAIHRTYEKGGVVRDVVAQHDEAIFVVVDPKLHIRINSKVLNTIKTKKN